MWQNVTKYDKMWQIKFSNNRLGYLIEKFRIDNGFSGNYFYMICKEQKFRSNAVSLKFLDHF